MEGTSPAADVGISAAGVAGTPAGAHPRAPFTPGSRAPGSRSARLAPVGRGVLFWCALALPAVTADRIGLNEPRPLWQQLAGLGVLAVAAALARRRPLAAFALTAALGLAGAPALFSVSYGPALATLALLLGLRAPRPHPAVAVLTGTGVAGAARIALVGVDPAPEALVLTGTLLFGCVLPWLGGRYWRQSRALAEAGWLRAARLEDEQRHAEERARLRERARIAQDMHDSLGHELSLLALRAAALQVAPASAPATATPRPNCGSPPPTPPTTCTASSASCARTTNPSRSPRPARPSRNSSPAPPSRDSPCAGNHGTAPYRPPNPAASPTGCSTGSCARR
ncbi:histidine kinase [Streptomyces sp. NPDC048568]|uniref:histidine kinase n=1 Tax=Streptomyces sp. NPDC048568 TaxID=3365571 RepID=UPI00371ECCD7